MPRPSGVSAMPRRTMSSALTCTMSSPSNSMAPADGFTRPAIVSSVVLLPAPLAPSSVTTSPG